VHITVHPSLLFSVYHAIGGLTTGASRIHGGAAAHFQKEHPILSDGVFFLERATRKAPKRRLRRIKRGAFEEVSRLSVAAAAVSRLTRR